MGASSAGAVVLVRFPFSDLTRSKVRPALVLARAEHDDTILCQITSNPYADSSAIELSEEGFLVGSLQRASYVRVRRIFTAHRELIHRQVGILKPDLHHLVVQTLVRTLLAPFA